jgi:hypothetical protein
LVSRLAQFFERFGDGIPQRAWTGSTKVDVDLFQPSDKVDNFPPRQWSTGRRAEMRAASKRAIVVDQTIAGCGLEHGTRAIRILWERFSSARAEARGGDDCFAFR